MATAEDGRIPRKLAAEAAFAAIQAGRSGDELTAYEEAYERSWVKKELTVARNFKPILTRFGTTLGGFLSMLDLWCTSLLAGFSFLGTLHHGKSDAECTGLAKNFKPIVYPKPDGLLILLADGHLQISAQSCSVRISRDRGQRFQSIVGSDFTGRWAVISRHRGRPVLMG